MARNKGRVRVPSPLALALFALLSTFRAREPSLSPAPFPSLLPSSFAALTARYYCLFADVAEAEAAVDDRFLSVPEDPELNQVAHAFVPFSLLRARIGGEFLSQPYLLQTSVPDYSHERRDPRPCDQFYEHPCPAPTIDHRAAPVALLPESDRTGTERERERERGRESERRGWGIGSTSIFRHVKPLAAAAVAATESAHTKRKKGTYSTTDLKNARSPTTTHLGIHPSLPLFKPTLRTPPLWDVWGLASTCFKELA